MSEGNIIRKINNDFNHARILVTAACNGLPDKMLETGIDYINSRKAFEKKLSDFQSIAFDAPDLKTYIEMAKLLTYKSAYLADTNSSDLYIQCNVKIKITTNSNGNSKKCNDVVWCIQLCKGCGN